MFVKLIVFSVLLLTVRASYRCGIRKHSTIELVHNGFNAVVGQWPWHTIIFHKQPDDSWVYGCGGTLINENHVLTAAHCVENSETRQPMKVSTIKLHFGQRNLSEVASPRMQVRDVRKVCIHPEHAVYQNDIAVLVSRLAVEFTDYVIPICLDRGTDRDLRKLVGQRGWITGYGTNEIGVASDVPRSASLPVVSYVQCLTDDARLFSNVLNPQVFCAGDRNGTGPGKGDSGGGMFFSEGDRWVLRGIISFAKVDEVKIEVDNSKYTVFTNVQHFLTWIEEVMAANDAGVKQEPKRISETECERFMSLAEKQSNGICAKSGYPHVVHLSLQDAGFCTGILVNENSVLTTCSCLRSITIRKVDTLLLDIVKGRKKPELSSFLSPIEIKPTARINIQEEHTISGWVCHPQYNPKAPDHFDMGILKLSSPVTLSSYLIPACLANNWTENLYDPLLQSGFTRDPSKDPILDDIYLQQSSENWPISREECEKYLSENHTKIPELLCVNNTDRMWIDLTMGSPLQTFNSRTCMFTVQAVMNQKSVRMESFAIDIYARIAFHLDWIEHVVWGIENSFATTTDPIPVEPKIGTWGKVKHFFRKLKMW